MGVIKGRKAEKGIKREEEMEGTRKNEYWQRKKVRK